MSWTVKQRGGRDAGKSELNSQQPIEKENKARNGRIANEGEKYSGGRGGEGSWWVTVQGGFLNHEGEMIGMDAGRRGFFQVLMNRLLSSIRLIAADFCRHI